MALSDAVDAATLASVVLAAFGVWWGLKTYRGQMNAQLFLAFTERYGSLMRDAPVEFRQWRLNSEATGLEVTQEIRMAILAYLNLCSEEYYLWQSGYLDHAIWRIWGDELERTLRSDLFKKEWPKLQDEFRSYGHFCDFVDAVQSQFATGRT